MIRAGPGAGRCRSSPSRESRSSRPSRKACRVRQRVVSRRGFVPSHSRRGMRRDRHRADRSGQALRSPPIRPWRNRAGASYSARDRSSSAWPTSGIGGALITCACARNAPLCWKRRAFAKRGLRKVLCEGGPTLLGVLRCADRVDELCLTISPLVEAGDAHRSVVGTPESVRRMMLHHVPVSDGTLMLRYLRASALTAAELTP